VLASYFLFALRGILYPESVFHTIRFMQKKSKAFVKNFTFKGKSLLFPKKRRHHTARIRRLLLFVGVLFYRIISTFLIIVFYSKD